MISGRKESGLGLVYFIRRDSDGSIKIGFTSKPLNYRAASIRWNFGKIAVLGVIENCNKSREASVHASLSNHRIKGEWFSDGRMVRNFIRSNAKPWRPTRNNSIHLCILRADNRCFVKSRKART